jgi:3-oxoacyl-[acyl-carrier protein] reductase
MKSRTVLVTGASRGIGEAIATGFRDKGWSVLAPSRAELDLSAPASLHAYCNACHTPVDGLVNNAGINVLSEAEAIDPSLWQAMLRIDLTAPLELAQRLAPGMRERKWGRILNISSVFSLVTKERRLAYSTVKAGLNGLTRTLALELAPHNVLVNALCPGYVETELTARNNGPAELDVIRESIPLGRLARPDEIARIAVFLCSEENTYLTGQCVVADGGFTLR